MTNRDHGFECIRVGIGMILVIYGLLCTSVMSFASVPLAPSWSLPFSAPSGGEIKKSMSDCTRGVHEYMQKLTLVNAIRSVGKLGYNAAKLQMVRILCTHTLPRSYSKMTQQDYQWWSGDTAQAVVFVLSTYALLESVYASYAPSADASERIKEKIRGLMPWCGAEKKDHKVKNKREISCRTE